MRWIPFYFLILSLSNVNKTTAQSADFSKGKWLKFTTNKPAIYQVSGTQLKQMGISLPIHSSKLQVFGFDVSNLTEKVPSIIPWGNQEISILVKDGGDGNFDEKDYFLFYAKGNTRWQQIPNSQHWRHIKFSHSDTAFYYFTIGENGKRIATENYVNNTAQKINSYTSHQLWEEDSVNILNSGNLWLGAPLGQGVGKIATQSIQLKNYNLVDNQPILFAANYVSTNYNQIAQFDLKLNEQNIRTTPVKPVSGLVYDASAISVLDSFTYWPTKRIQTNANLLLQYNAPVGSTGWLDYLEIHLPEVLGFSGASCFSFDAPSATQDYQYEITNADTTAIVWDITNALVPKQINVAFQVNKISFSAKPKYNQSFIALKQNAFETVIKMDSLPNQEIFNNAVVDYLIIAPNFFKDAANKLKNFHQQKNGFKVEIVDPETIYNNFSGGLTSPIAIRNYIKLLHSLAKDSAYKPIEYVLLMGGADFNLKKLNKANQVPVFESAASLEILNSYASDDFYAILKEGADINYPSSVEALEIAIGRIPAKTKAEADTMVNKIIQYALSNKKGLWQQQITWIADDADYNLHLQDAEGIIEGLEKNNPIWNHKKIYLDLFPATKTAGGLNYPTVNNEIKQTVNNGTLLLNYTGHGNYLRLTEEAVINENNMQEWENAGRLPLMVTASCDFAPYDQPQLNPIGFKSLLQNNKGILGLVAANRLVFAYSNKQINEQYIQALLVPDKNGLYNSIGKALQKAKNNNWAIQGDKLNAFKFSLLGDPALKLVRSNNAIQLAMVDSLDAGELISIKGDVIKEKSLHTIFNGYVDFIVFDAAKEKTTLVNQSTSIQTTISTKESIIYRGKASVNNGKFTIMFVLPKEIHTNNGSLRIQAYAYNDLEDAFGMKENIYVKQTNWTKQSDTIGPEVVAFINDTNFTNYSWVSEYALLTIHLKDSAGIQSSGNALGRDLQLIIDNDIQNPYLLNNYYVADIDSYQSGTIMYSLPNFSVGKHQIVIKAWDLLNNATKDTLWFIVPEKDQLMAKGLVNKPNPMYQYTQFSFDLNLQDKTIQTEFSLRNLNGVRFVIRNLPNYSKSNKWVMDWDGRDQSGATVPPGYYVYTITIRAGNKTIVLSNKLIKL